MTHPTQAIEALQRGTPLPDTFWYDFLTGPALGGVCALLAAIGVAASAWLVSRHRRTEAGREEWFRRLQWAQELSVAEDEDTATAGFEVMAELATSKLASTDDLKLLGRLMTTIELEAQNQADEGTVDERVYVVDTDGDGRMEEEDHGEAEQDGE